MRNFAFGIAAIVFAALSGLQAASMVFQRTAPTIALQANPGNGQALGRLAQSQFSADVAEGKTPEDAAARWVQAAQMAIRNEPLNPRAHAILAWAAETSKERQRILTASLDLNRRSSALQALSLQERTKAGDVDGSIETLDQVLRVHPETSEQFFPVLTQALTQEGSLVTFERILSRNPPWQDNFLLFASRTENAVVNAAKLRRTVTVDNVALDNTIIERLVGSKSWSHAFEHYAFLTNRSLDQSQAEFRSEFPPIEWKFADKRGMRAQLANDGQGIELYLKSGEGGVMMQRLVRSDQTQLKIAIEHDISPRLHWPNMGLRVKCAGSSDILFDQKFPDDVARFAPQISTSGCQYLEVALYARVYTGSPAMRGDVTRFSID